jgi:hypothetical protein
MLPNQFRNPWLEFLLTIVLHIVGTVMLFVKATTLTIFQDAYANY